MYSVDPSARPRAARTLTTGVALLLWVALSACIGDRYSERVCVSDDECLGARVCIDGVCVDPLSPLGTTDTRPPRDTHDGDTGLDTRDTGAEVDTRDTGAEIDARDADTEIDARDTGAEVDTRDTGAEIDARDADTEIDARDAGTEIDARDADTEIDARDAGAELDTRDAGAELDTRDAGTELDTRDAGTELDTRDAGTELDTRDAGAEVDTRDTGTEMDTSGCPVLGVGAARTLVGPFVAGATVLAGSTVYLDAGHPSPGRVSFTWEAVGFPRTRPTVSRTSVAGRVSFVAADAGDYDFIVSYDDGRGCEGRGSIRIVVDAATGVGEGLRFVITWRTPGDADELTDPGTDVDMHLAPGRSAETAAWRTESDCYYANRSTTWGGRLLRDEVDGLGPEILVLESPGGRPYQLAIHYFSDDGFGPSDVTLRVFLDGIQLASATQRLGETGDVWMAAEVADDGSVELTPGRVRDGWP
ncbi:MAG: hypothetical protein H6698_06435 [Myxococcales bacterium]|nr:hypothetical protein [Myxococcales bacterium]MCB9533944.1 hypothetical protein [Myxococcales bacterium]